MGDSGGPTLTPFAPSDDALVDLELVIANGTVVDGTGAPRYRADVGVQGGRIVAVSQGGGLAGARVVDASGLVVAPGFVDLDSHVDWAVAERSASGLARWLRQGVTTAIGGACGFSPAPVLRGGAADVARATEFLRDGPFAPRWSTFGELLDEIGDAGVPLNVGFLAGHVTLRTQALGAARTGTRDVRSVLLDGLREALRSGALGVAANAGALADARANAAELGAIAELVAREGGLLAVHARAYTRVSAAYPPRPTAGPHNLRAVRELVELARRTGVRLHVLHLVVAGRRTWRTAEEVLRCLEAARADGVDVSFDAAPYTVAVGPVSLLFAPRLVERFAERGPPRSVRALRLLSRLQRVLLGMGPEDVRLRGAGGDPDADELVGRSFAEIARLRGMNPLDAELEVARRSGMNGASVLFGASSGDRDEDGPLRAILSHPLCAIATNAASMREGPQNPAIAGAFPRVLARLVRELALLTLEEAIRKMTSLPAGRLGLDDLGRVAEGWRADLVLLDPARVRDPPEPERTDAVPEGIRMVVVSGVPVVDDGVVAPGLLPGRVIRRAAR